ncbi:hypothetical protein [Gracilinema caldarium]|uniref:Uncharacterized protein n=1 Tax=Gracilinema caldarium (strain ATCC 51460 / DSM 7334 / H1) TaxID=744872 RepID=F8F2J1_GRAC1|nr:hypothetical protein [Gracilinema caldarium]AEJ19106.1 hypothetical protein Spica_0956 [Gracilinema caldarium DSM 7334]
MKQNIRYLFIGLLLAGVGVTVSGIDISLYGSLGNIAFDTSRTTALSDGNQAFSENLSFYGIAQLDQKIAENTNFTVLFNHDPILRNSLYTTIAYDTGYAKITVGPFFGLFNSSSSMITSGLSTTLTMTIPGIIYGSFRSDTTIGAGINLPGDYVQQRNELAIGLWGPNTLTSFKVSTKTFTYKKNTDLTVVDTVTNYDWVTEVFKKYIPYTATITLGYQSLKRSYIDVTTSNDELAAFMIGLDASFKFSDNFKITGGGKAPLYAWGVGNLKSPDDTTILYEATLGLTATIDTLRLPKRKPTPLVEQVETGQEAIMSPGNWAKKNVKIRW